MVFMVHEIML